MIYDFLINIIETCIFCFFLTYASKAKVKWFPILLYILVGTASISFFNYYQLDETWYFLLEAAYGFTYLSFVSDLDYLNKIILSLFPEMMLSIVGVSFIIFSSQLLIGRIDFIALKTAYGNETDLLAQLLYLVSFFITAHKIRNMDIHFTDKEKKLLIIVVMTAQLLLLSISSLILVDRLNDIHITLSMFLAIVLIYLLFLIYSDIAKINRDSSKALFEKSLIESQLSANQKLLQSQETLYRMRHDIKHLLNTFDSSTTDLSKIDSMKQELNDISLPFQTRSPAVNSVLNIKRMEAKEKGIDFLCSVQLIRDIPMDNEDICLLLSNLVDNAIQHIGISKKIEVDLSCNDNQFITRVSNSIDAPVLNQNKEFIQSPSLSHGYGIPTIKALVNKYRGHVKFDQTDSTFVALSVIPVQSEISMDI